MSGAGHAGAMLALFAAVFGIILLLARRMLPGPAAYRLRKMKTAAPGGAALVRRREPGPGPGLLRRLRDRRRRRALAHAFPDLLDLLVVCLEAGLGIDAAIARVSADMALHAPELAAELEQVSLELRAGAGRQAALRAMAQRTGLHELQALAAVLAQAERFGTGVAAALRQHAAELRLRRRLLAEERAARLALKLLFPLIFCIFPSLLLVLLGPASIQVRQALLSGAAS
ncbi:type II secretion system F family protein|uniref:type II secretion system F family protein n=1 Tax=Noviherbaspirillum sp. L7-7A TaxID=2850560 RepID=UPI001C2C25E8|nr:type II secretion system F family protein [Noviherbaspirillum sp. L7-7A]MBV0880119.1 type II secretion system F family protein [Noviherbaspirillum sp. L7-7A]